ncbi:MAG TPA: 1,4-alpha-glucan branching enzyme, partial [Aquiluna sp.]
MNPEASALQAVAEGRHHSPHSVLGFHQQAKDWVLRVLRPFAKSVSIKTKKSEHELTHVYDGIWELRGNSAAPGDYRVVASYDSAPDWVSDDPYRYLPKLGDLDLHLIAEGRHEELWQALGAHLIESKDSLGDTSGASFKLWAPNAQAVRVVGDFNSWDGRAYAMRSMGGSGVWELYVPGVKIG